MSLAKEGGLVEEEEDEEEEGEGFTKKKEVLAPKGKSWVGTSHSST